MKNRSIWHLADVNCVIRRILINHRNQAKIFDGYIMEHVPNIPESEYLKTSSNFSRKKIEEVVIVLV